ncbi:MAG: glycosyltransferase [Caldilineales bacterium]
MPVFITLPDLEPGVAIRRMSRFASRVGVSFDEAAAYFPGKAVVTGYLVRPEILALAGKRAEARAALGLAADVPVLLVFGGSRGARSINQALAAALPAILEHCQVVHVSGTLDWPEVTARSETVPNRLRGRYHPFPYLHDEMAWALAAADLVVARAGASTLGEFPALGLPSILVPYPYSGQHQDVNADFLAARGAAVKIVDADLDARLGHTVIDLLQDRARMQQMRTAATSLARPDAAARIAQELRRLAERGKGSVP